MLLQIPTGGSAELRVIFQKSKRTITIVAKDTAILSRRVAVVQVGLGCSQVDLTNAAQIFLCYQHSLVFFECDAILANKPGVSDLTFSTGRNLPIPGYHHAAFLTLSVAFILVLIELVFNLYFFAASTPMHILW